MLRINSFLNIELFIYKNSLFKGVILQNCNVRSFFFPFFFSVFAKYNLCSLYYTKTYANKKETFYIVNVKSVKTCEK